MTCHEIERKARRAVKYLLSWVSFILLVGFINVVTIILAVELNAAWWWGPLYGIGIIAVFFGILYACYLIEEWYNGNISICRKEKDNDR